MANTLVPSPPVNATESRPGLVSTADQSFKGHKTFKDNVIIEGQLNALGDSVNVTAAGGNTPRSLAERHGEEKNVRDFGAKGDGVTNDTAAIQDAVDEALVSGGDVVFPPGLYRVTGTINVGLPIVTGYSFITGRTVPMDDPTTAANTIPANIAANKLLPAIDIRFACGAHLVADFTPAAPTPVLAYNLPSEYHTEGGVHGLSVLGPAAVVNGAYKYPDPAPAVDNNLIGLFIARGARVADRLFFSALNYGLVSLNGFWQHIRDVRAERCGDAMHIAQGNALRVANLVLWSSRRGLIFDGAASDVQDIHCQQVREELTVLSGDCSLFGPAYFEDVDEGAGDGAGKYALTLGTTTDTSQVKHCSFRGLRFGSERASKKAMRMWGTRKAEFSACRTYSRTVDTDSTSEGVLVACDFDLQTLNFSSLNAAVRPGQLTYPNSARGVAGIFFQHGLALPGTSVAAGAVATVDLTVPGVKADGRSAAYVSQVSGLSQDFDIHWARVSADNIVNVRIRNTSAGALNLSGTVAIIVFQGTP